jgi:hypothetical protein
VSKAEKIIEQMRRSPQNVRFDDLAKVCADHFGEPRQDGTAKVYQVRQVHDAIAKLEAEKNEESDDDA